MLEILRDTKNCCWETMWLSWLYFILEKHKSVILAIWSRFPESLYYRQLTCGKWVGDLLSPAMCSFSCWLPEWDIWAGEGSLAQLAAFREEMLESSFLFCLFSFLKVQPLMHFFIQRTTSNNPFCKRDWNNRVRVYLSQYILDNYKWFVLIIYNVLIFQTRVENGCVKSI